MENHLPLRISLPFVGGIALAAALPAPAVPMAVAALVGVIACMLGLVAGRRADKPLITAMLFFLGVFCFASRTADILGGGSVLEGLVPHFRPLSEWLGRVIDQAGFDCAKTAPLLRALMTGDRSGLDRGIVAAFRSSGASHLLALSGLHLGIVAMCVRFLLMLLGKSRLAGIVRSTLLVLFCLVYTLACGASPSLVRAFLFVVLGQIAAHSPHRRSTPADRLCIAATVQLSFDPRAIGSLAFQLSYLAMIGIVFVAPRLEAWYPSTALSYRFDPIRAIWKAMALALSCQLTTAPLVWLRFGSLPHYFLLTNLLAMPVCELLLPVAILTLLLGSPSLLVSLTDRLAGILIRILTIISGL